MLFSTFLTITISCSDAIRIINRLSSVVGLSYQQKIEIIQTIREYIPTCPVVINKDGNARTN